MSTKSATNRGSWLARYRERRARRRAMRAEQYSNPDPERAKTVQAETVVKTWR